MDSILDSHAHFMKISRNPVKIYDTVITTPNRKHLVSIKPTI